MTKFAMAIDKKRCVACNRCSMACKVEHNLPLGLLWNQALYNGTDRLLVPQGTQEEGLKTEMYTLACQHCDEPACVEACPTGASAKREDGIVTVDYETCIGCESCVAACPYEGVRTNAKDPQWALDFKVGDAAVLRGAHRPRRTTCLRGHLLRPCTLLRRLGRPGLRGVEGAGGA